MKEHLTLHESTRSHRRSQAMEHSCSPHGPSLIKANPCPSWILRTTECVMIDGITPHRLCLQSDWVSRVASSVQLAEGHDGNLTAGKLWNRCTVCLTLAADASPIWSLEAWGTTGKLSSGDGGDPSSSRTRCGRTGARRMTISGWPPPAIRKALDFEIPGRLALSLRPTRMIYAENSFHGRPTDHR